MGQGINLDKATLRLWTQAWPSTAAEQLSPCPHYGLMWQHSPLTSVWPPVSAWPTDTNMDLISHGTSHEYPYVAGKRKHTQFTDINLDLSHIRATDLHMTLSRISGHGPLRRSNPENELFFILGFHGCSELAGFQGQAEGLGS